MLGRTHALTGATAWLTFCAIPTAVDAHPALSTWAVGAIVAAGSALLPDVDCTDSTVARLLGSVSAAGCRAIGAGCAKVYGWTRTDLDKSVRDGHRTLTHTLAAALAAVGLVVLSCWLGGRPASVMIIALSTVLSMRALLPHRILGAFVALVLAGLVIVPVAFAVPSGGWLWLGLPVGLGWAVHCLGDALTKSGAPLLWPIPISGCRWRRLAPPHRLLRVTHAGMVEKLILAPLFAVVTAWLVLILI